MSILDQVRSRLIEQLQHALSTTGWLDDVEQMPEIVLDIPKEKSHGDFSTNLAMRLTRIVGKNPREIATAIVEALDTKQAGVDRVEIAGPGFINFYTNKDYLLDVVGQIISADRDYGRIEFGKGKRIQVEFVSANPTGSLHLGHARGAAVGDALCNVLDFSGYEVSREYYINDAGNQVENLAKSLEARYLQQLGRDAEMPEDGYHGEDIREFAKQLVEQEGERLLDLREEERMEFLLAFGLEKELDKIRRDLARFGVEFDVWYSERSLYETGKVEAALEALKANGKVFEEEGAVWLDTMNYGDDKNRVLVKQDGSYTYLTPDIAYHRDKLERGFDELINIWGADHHGYIPRVKAALAALGYDPERLTVLIAQMVSLFQDGEKVKMSKRTGKAVTMEELMDEVGVDAIRYFFTMRSMDSHLDFDLDLAVSTSNENPVYYVQYAHARICSIYRQAEEQGITRKPLEEVDLSVLNHELELDLLRKLAELPDEIEMAATLHAPHRLVRYVYEVASQFHSYYKAERVITDDIAKTEAKLKLLEAVQIVIRNVLGLIGVSAPESM